MQIRALTWNVFHGRDFPPDPALRSRRSRLLRIPERGDTHVQVNADLSHHFHALVAEADWDVAMLQEFPPRWAEPLARRCGAESHLVLTSRNSLAPLRRLGARLNPDLIGSNEGGSNLVLIRPTLGPITERRSLAVCPGPDPERRMLSFTRTTCGLCVANMHLSAGHARLQLAEGELQRAAEQSVAWSGGAPLILGGDLNIRPRDSQVYDRLKDTFGLAGTTADDCLDHLLTRGLEIVEEPARWPVVRREVVRPDGLRLRLSDHTPVAATYRS